MLTGREQRPGCGCARPERPPAPCSAPPRNGEPRDFPTIPPQKCYKIKVLLLVWRVMALCLPSPQTLAFVGEMPVTQHADQTVWRVGPRDCVPVPRRLHVPPTPDPSAARGRAPDLADVRAEPVTAATIDCTRTCAAAVPGAVLVLGALRGGLASPSLPACAYSASCRAGSRSVTTLVT